MSRCASGSSSMRTCGRRARQAASATSLRWPPLSSLVGMASALSGTPRSSRSPRASPSARSPPSSAQRASSRSWWASARAMASRSVASAGSASRRSTACSSPSSAASSGPGGAHPAQRRALVAGHVLGQERVDEPAPARDGAGVRLLEPGEDRQQRRLAAAVRTEHADAHAVGELEIEPVEDEAPAERLRQAAGGEERDDRHRDWLGSHHAADRACRARVRSASRGRHFRGRRPDRTARARPTPSSGWTRTRSTSRDASGGRALGPAAVGGHRELAAAHRRRAGRGRRRQAPTGGRWPSTR